MNSLQSRRFRILGLFMLVAGASAALAHPGHSASESTPWYRYLPPGAPLPGLSRPRRHFAILGA